MILNILYSNLKIYKKENLMKSESEMKTLTLRK